MIIREISERLIRKLNLNSELSQWDDEDNIILEGGGHGIYSFATLTDGRRFNSLLSENVLREFPGIELNCALIDFDEKIDHISDAIDNLFRKLSMKKQQPEQFRQISYGIERLCDSSQLPAIYNSSPFVQDNRPLSREIECKIEFSIKHKPQSYFVDLIPDTPFHLVKIDSQVDNIASDERKNKIAVIHIDGNGMGKKVNTFKEMNHQKDNESIPKFNKRFRDEFRKFSNDIDEKYKRAFRRMLVRLETAIHDAPEDSDLSPYKKGLHVRPVVFAGDDITFIIPGELGVSAGKIMLQELQKEPLLIKGNNKEISIPMNACGGVAIVKSGYPFSAAYDLAEQLCDQAKAKLANDCVKKGRLPNEDASILDFHILKGSFSRSLVQLRKHHYEIEANGQTCHLTMKPLYILSAQELKKADADVYSFSQFAKSFSRILRESTSKRGKIKQLRERIVMGPDAVKQFLKLYDPERALTKDFPPLADDQDRSLFTSSKDHTCLYFDAIEAMDDVLLLAEGESR